MLSSMLMVSSVLDVSSNSSPSIDDVLFSEDLSLAIRLEPKMASKSTLDALSSGTTSGPKVRPDLRCMYDYEVQVVLGVLLALCSGYYCQFAQFRCRKLLQRAAIIIAAPWLIWALLSL